MNAVALILIALFALPAMIGWVVIGLAIYGQRLNCEPLFWLMLPVILFAWLCDVLLNQLLHLLLWDVRGYTITQRLKTYLSDSSGWRYELAVWLRPVVNALDKGHL